jgi:hypothetical protein
MTRRTKTGVTRMITDIVPMETWPAASLHRRSVVEGMVGTIVTSATSSATEMHTAGLKTATEIMSVMSRSSVIKGTMTIMAPTMTNLTGSILQKGDTFQEVSMLILEILKGCVGP